MDRTGLALMVAVGLALGFAFLTGRLLAIDSPDFWNAGHSAHYYSDVWVSRVGGSYLYPPPLAQLAGLLPWPAYIIGWTVLLFVAWWAATREWALPTFIGSVLLVATIGYSTALTRPLDQTAIGNPQILIAAVCVIGFRWPAAWAFVLLTKVTPGIGLLWFAVRREWRSLGIALAATAIVAGVSLILAPGAWAEYVRFLMVNVNAVSPEPVVPIPLLVRLPMSAALVTWGALTNRRWTVPVAAGWAAVALYEGTYMAVWIAALVLVTRKAPTPERAGANATAGRAVRA